MQVEAVIYCDAPVALPVHRLMAAAFDASMILIALGVFLAIFFLSGGQIVRFELRPKDKTINLRLPESLLNAVRRQAEKAGMPYQRYIRIALEQAVGGGKP